MVIDAESFYGKRKNEMSAFEMSIAKYESLKKIKLISESNTNIKKKKFYKQKEAFLYYEYLKKQFHSIRSKNVLIYTEELDNCKRSFIVDSFFSFIKFYSFYALNLDTIYFKEEEKQQDLKKKEVEEKKEKTIGLLEWLEGDNYDNSEKEVVETNLCLKSQVKKEIEEIYSDSNENDNKKEIKEKYKKQIRDKIAHTEHQENRKEYLHLYELIVTEEKRWLYFDIEYECNNENRGNKETILFIFLIEFCLFVFKKFNIKLNLIDVLILDSSSNSKISFHIIIKNIHSVPYDYFEYLIDYCYFFLTETKLPENSFYKKYKNNNAKAEAHRKEQNYLLFDNEETIKHFVELFINKIIKKINKTENIKFLKSQSICLDFYKSDSINKERFHLDKHVFPDVTNVSVEQRKGDFHLSVASNNSSSKSSTASNASDHWKCGADGRNNYIEQKEIRMKDDRNKESGKENVKNQYFEICKHTLKEVIEYYINKLKKNCKNSKKYNYIILLYAMKKKNSNATLSKKETLKKKHSNINDVNSVSSEKENSQGTLFQKINSKVKDEKANMYVENIKKEKIEGNISDEELKKDIEWFFRNHNEFFDSCSPYSESTDNKEECFLLHCVIDSSVYSRNRNFRMIFSSKKNKENILLLSPLNVKKYNKKKINDVILKSLITYNCEDAKYQIKKERIYKYKETEEVYKFHVFKRHNQFPRIYRKSVMKNNRCKIVKYNNLNHSHLNIILKIIFFWNFLLYKNFKKNKTYMTTLRGEIEKEYFYKIISVYNNFNFKKYEDIINFVRKTQENEEIDVSIRRHEQLHKKEEFNTHIINTYLDNFDDLFLQSVIFFEDLLQTYKIHFNLGDEEDHRIFFVRYFLYSLTSEDDEYTLFFRDNKFCKNKNFSHKSNHIYLVYNIRHNLFIQKCYDEDCKHFVSDIYQF